MGNAQYSSNNCQNLLPIYQVMHVKLNIYLYCTDIDPLDLKRQREGEHEAFSAAADINVQ
jgi:hypothetical protein